MKLDSALTPYTKINSKVIKDINVRDKTLRRKHMAKLHDIGSGNNFLDVTPEEQAKREKIAKLDFIKIKCLLCVKRHYQLSEKATHRMGENICKSCI